MRELRKLPAGFAMAMPYSLGEDSQQNARKASNHRYFLRATRAARNRQASTQLRWVVLVNDLRMSSTSADNHHSPDRPNSTNPHAYPLQKALSMVPGCMLR